MKKQIIQMMGSRIRRTLTLAMAAAMSALVCAPGYAADSSAPYGRLDGIRQQADGYHVYGWAMDRDFAGPISILLEYVPNGVGSYQFLASGATGGGSYNFDIPVVLPEGKNHRIYATALNLDSDGRFSRLQRDYTLLGSGALTASNVPPLVADDPAAQEYVPSAVYNPADEQYMVVYTKTTRTKVTDTKYIIDSSIYAKLMDIDGIAAGPAALISDGNTLAGAAVGLNPSTNEYYAVWSENGKLQGAILTKGADLNVVKKNQAQVHSEGNPQLDAFGYAVGAHAVQWDEQQGKFLVIFQHTLGGCVNPDSEGICTIRATQLKGKWVSKDGVPEGAAFPLSDAGAQVVSDQPKVVVDNTLGFNRYVLFYQQYDGAAKIGYFPFDVYSEQGGVLKRMRKTIMGYNQASTHKSTRAFDIVYDTDNLRYYLRYPNLYDLSRQSFDSQIDGRTYEERGLDQPQDGFPKVDIQMTYSKDKRVISAVTSQISAAYSPSVKGTTQSPIPFNNTTLVGGTMFSLEGDHDYSDVTVFYTEQFTQDIYAADIRMMMLKF